MILPIYPQSERVPRLLGPRPRILLGAGGIVAVVCAAAGWFAKPEYAITIAIAVVGWLFWRVVGLHRGAFFLGLAGLGLLVFAAYRIYRLEALTMTLPLVLMFALGLMLASFASFMISVLSSRSHRWLHAIAAVVVVAISLVFYLVIFDWACNQRVLRHRQELADAGSMLCDISDDVEAWRNLHGRVPSDGEIQDVLMKHRLAYRGRGWACLIDYRKVSSQRFRLLFCAKDVAFIYDSDDPSRGWKIMDGELDSDDF
jgi:hypothetical protein